VEKCRAKKIEIRKKFFEKGQHDDSPVARHSALLLQSAPCFAGFVANHSFHEIGFSPSHSFFACFVYERSDFMLYVCLLLGTVVWNEANSFSSDMWVEKMNYLSSGRLGSKEWKAETLEMMMYAINPFWDKWVIAFLTAFRGMEQSIISSFLCDIIENHCIETTCLCAICCFKWKLTLFVDVETEIPCFHVKIN